MLSALLYHARVPAARLRDARGQTMPEYAILIGVIALVVIAAAVLLGAQISGALGGAATAG